MKNFDFLEQIQEMLRKNEKPLTFEEALLFLRVSKSTLYKLTHTKKIPFTKPGGKKLYFKKADLINWMNSNPVKSAAQIDEEAANYVTFK